MKILISGSKASIFIHSNVFIFKRSVMWKGCWQSRNFGDDKNRNGIVLVSNVYTFREYYYFKDDEN